MTGDVLIRPETAADRAAIHDLTRRAFLGKRYSDGTEPDLIDALRAAGALAVSLVAEQNGVIVGHIALAPALAEDGSSGWYSLGPISVEPRHQRRGIGRDLIREGMERLVARGAAGCVLIGDTNYYPRHGFVPRPELAPAGEPAEHYMVRPLAPLAPETCVSFHPVFQDFAGTP